MILLSVFLSYAFGLQNQPLLFNSPLSFTYHINNFMLIIFSEYLTTLTRQFIHLIVKIKKKANRFFYKNFIKRYHDNESNGEEVWD